MRTTLIVLALLCLAAGAADFLIHKHGHYAWEEWPFAQGAFGFLGCAALVLVALLLGKVLGRPEDYYDE